MKLKFLSKSIISWFFFDWANSAFTTAVTTFIFATYFTEKVAINRIVGTAQWGRAMSLAAFFIALSSPIFGAIADYEGRRKPWLAAFTFLTIIGSAALWYVKPNAQYVYLALAAVVIAEIGLEVGSVFYNSMLRDLVPMHFIGRASGWGWGFGYLGGLVALCILLFVLLNENIQIFHFSGSELIRLTGPFSALWLLLFSMPLFLFTPDRKKSGITYRAAIKYGLKNLKQTLTSVIKYKNIFRFLLARMIYIDGLNTIFAFGGIYAAGTFGMNIHQVVLFGIALNISAGIGAILFGWVDDWLGPKISILMTLFVMMISGLFMVLVKSILLFWIFGIFLSFCVGPVQASSRSFMVRLSPKENITEMFGLYALSGRVTAFLGPLALGWATLHFNSQRAGVSTIMLFLLTGGILLLFVKEGGKIAKTPAPLL